MLAQSLGWEDPLEEGMVTHSSILAWRIPWTEEPGGLQPMRSQKNETEVMSSSRSGIRFFFFFLVTDLFHLAECFLGSFMLQVSGPPPFLRLRNIPLGTKHILLTHSSTNGHYSCFHFFLL